MLDPKEITQREPQELKRVADEIIKGLQEAVNPRTRIAFLKSLNAEQMAKFILSDMCGKLRDCEFFCHGCEEEVDDPEFECTEEMSIACLAKWLKEENQ